MSQVCLGFNFEDSDLSDIPTMSLSEIVSKSDELLLQLNQLKSNEIIATEGLGSFILGVFRTILDFIIKINKNIAVTLTKFYKDLKRTEFRAYCDSHKLAINHLHSNFPYMKVSTIDVKIPAGMTCTFNEITRMLSRAFSSLDMGNKSKFFKIYAKELAASVKANSVSSVKLALDTSDFTKNIFSKNSKITDDIRNCFKVSQSYTNATARYDKVFDTSGNAVREVYNTLLVLEKEVLVINTAISDLHDTEKSVDSIIKTIEENSELSINKKDLENIAKIVRGFAEAFDKFAQTIDIYSRVEHSMVANYNLFLSKV